MVDSRTPGTRSGEDQTLRVCAVKAMMSVRQGRAEGYLTVIVEEMTVDLSHGKAHYRDL
jgi:hypothetical protein